MSVKIREHSFILRELYSLKTVKNNHCHSPKWLTSLIKADWSRCEFRIRKYCFPRPPFLPDHYLEFHICTTEDKRADVMLHESSKYLQSQTSSLQPGQHFEKWKKGWGGGKSHHIFTERHFALSERESLSWVPAIQSRQVRFPALAPVPSSQPPLHWPVTYFQS